MRNPFASDLTELAYKLERHRAKRNCVGNIPSFRRRASDEPENLTPQRRDSGFALMRAPE
jgi:hypothetical protein